MKRLLALIAALLMLITGCAFAAEDVFVAPEVLVDEQIAMTSEWLVEYGYDYLTAGEVALYLHAFGELPPNYITKEEAYELGWKSKSYDLWDVAYGLHIGGSEFGNREGLLPDAEGRQWYECDVNCEGSNRGAERLVYATDGLIYYTADHYESFEQLYDGWYNPDFLYGVEYDEYGYVGDDYEYETEGLLQWSW